MHLEPTPNSVTHCECTKSRINKKDKFPYPFAHKKIWTYFQEQNEASNKNLKEMHENIEVLTRNEVELIVKTYRMMSNMGLGIDKDTCLLVVNCILSNQIKKRIVLVTR